MYSDLKSNKNQQKANKNQQKTMKIAICGKMCSGKSTLCDKIQTSYPTYNFQRTAMAKRLKELASELFGMDPAKKDRELMINFGGKMREIDSNVWINTVLRETENNGGNWLLDDCRYKNEFDALRANGWKIIKLKVSAETQLERIKKLYPNDVEKHQQFGKHVTENEALALNDELFDIVLEEDYDFGLIKII